MGVGDVLGEGDGDGSVGPQAEAVLLSGMGGLLGLAFVVEKLPFAALIDKAGVIRAKGLVNSREHLESLFEAHERGVASLQEFLASE